MSRSPSLISQTRSNGPTRTVWKLIFLPLHTHTLLTHCLYSRVFFVLPVLLASRDQDGSPSNSQTLQSHGKIGAVNILMITRYKMFELFYHAPQSLIMLIYKSIVNTCTVFMQVQTSNLFIVCLVK